MQDIRMFAQLPQQEWKTQRNRHGKKDPKASSANDPDTIYDLLPPPALWLTNQYAYICFIFQTLGNILDDLLYPSNPRMIKLIDLENFHNKSCELRDM